MKITTLSCFAFVLTGLLSVALVAQEPAATEAKSNSDEGAEIIAKRVETLATDIDGGSGGIEVDSNGIVYTADFGYRLDGKGKGGNKVFKITPAGEVSLFNSEMRGASGNAMDSAGVLYQSSIGGNFISKITPDGKSKVFSRDGIKNPVGVLVDNNDTVYVCNCGGNSIQKITKDGKSSEFVKSELLKCPNGIAADTKGNLYVANFMNGNVIKITADGKPSRLATLPGNNNGHLAFHAGNLYVVARKANQIYRVTLDGNVKLFAGSGKRGKDDGEPTKATFSLPNDIAVSPDGRFLYVNEVGPITGDHRILGPTRIRRIVLKDE